LFPATISFSATTGANGQLTFAVNVKQDMEQFAGQRSDGLLQVTAAGGRPPYPRRSVTCS
jgi:hypothetical protein